MRNPWRSGSWPSVLLLVLAVILGLALLATLWAVFAVAALAGLAVLGWQRLKTRFNRGRWRRLPMSRR